MQKFRHIPSDGQNFRLNLDFLMATSKASLKILAEMAGVSKATASWVLSGQGRSRGISPETCERVMNMAKELGYRPNRLAQGLSTGKSHTIGVVLSSLADPFYGGLALALIDEAEKRGYSVMMATSESDSVKETNAIKIFVENQMDGILVTPCLASKQALCDYINEGVNIVMIDRGIDGVTAPSVVMDNRESARTLVAGLIAKGCRKIAIFTTSHNLENMQERYLGYCDALEDAGLSIDEHLICEFSSKADVEDRNRKIDELLAYEPDIDGIFFTTHVLVLSTYSHFVDLGRDTYRGEHWACIHSTDDFKLILPGIAIAQIPIQEMGKKSVELLLERAGNACGQVVLPSEPIMP